MCCMLWWQITETVTKAMLQTKKGIITIPSFSEALAFHILMFISSEAENTNLLSGDHCTQATLCILFVW